jgi:hypothetical protein
MILLIGVLLFGAVVALYVAGYIIYVLVKALGLGLAALFRAYDRWDRPHAYPTTRVRMHDGTWWAGQKRAIRPDGRTRLKVTDAGTSCWRKGDLVDVRLGGK